uniref:Uncharacterized protein n=1 Tax=Anguilla anguilla TaxID=7936 RepID=A0A0E9PCD6_ANGAN
MTFTRQPSYKYIRVKYRNVTKIATMMMMMVMMMVVVVCFVVVILAILCSV